MKLLKKVACILFAVCLTCSLIHTVFASEVIDTRTLAMVNKPGVVLVQTMWTADITWYEFSFISGFEEDLSVAIEELVINGIIPYTEEGMYSAMVQLMIENMGYYAFSTGNAQTETASTAAVGTGFIVTPDGYLLTNAHVVHTNEEELYMQFARTALNDYAVSGADEFAAEMRRNGYQMSQEEWDGIANAFYSLLAQSMEINNLQTSYSCYMGNATPGSDVSAKGIGLDLRIMGEPIPGKDVAVLKLDKSNLPTVSIGDDTQLRTGDKVYAMGYPAVATLSEALNIAQAIQEPTLTQGIISAKKEMAGGWSILQTDAAIHGGNSGGPLFNEAGEVIGINTFGMIDSESGGIVAGMNFAVPISVAMQFMNEINVTPSESQFTKQFKEAHSLFSSGNYNEALKILRGLNETSPGYPVVIDLLAQCSAKEDAQSHATVAISDEADGEMSKDDTKSEKSQKNNLKKVNVEKDLQLMVIVAAGVVVFLAFVVVITLLMRRKKALSVYPTHTENLHKPGGFCSQCGAPITPGKKFCSECGTKL